MNVAEHVARALSPHLGANTADSVARHLCAKHGIGEGQPDAESLQKLQETLRRGLVAFVGNERAAELAEECLKGLSEAG